MPKAHLDRCWSYAQGPFSAKAYGPGETEIPEGLYDLLSEKGYLGSSELEDVDGVGEGLANDLRQAGFDSPQDLSNASDEELLAIDGIGPAKLKAIRGNVG